MRILAIKSDGRAIEGSAKPSSQFDRHDRAAVSRRLSMLPQKFCRGQVPSGRRLKLLAHLLDLRRLRFAACGDRRGSLDGSTGAA